jgi:hypothetical protein
MTSVPKPEFPCRVDHYYCTSSTVSQTGVQVPVLTDVFDSTRRKVGTALVIILNCLFLCGAGITHDIGLFFLHQHCA